MKPQNILLAAAMVCALLLSGCRSQTNSSTMPSTTAAPTTQPMTTQPATAPEETTQTTANTDPTIPSGNGPIEETGPDTTTKAPDDGTSPASRSGVRR